MPSIKERINEAGKQECLRVLGREPSIDDDTDTLNGIGISTLAEMFKETITILQELNDRLTALEEGNPIELHDERIIKMFVEASNSKKD